MTTHRLYSPSNNPPSMPLTLFTVTTSDASYDSNDIHDLLPTMLLTMSYLLSYSIPLLLVSTILVFAGAFLMLDRTRNFTPHQLASPSPKRRPCLLHISPFLEGGIGGLAVGFAFGAHFATFLALLIPSINGSPPLGPKSFLAVFFLSGVFCSALAGRWKYVALILAGLTGFASFSLSLSVIVHPTLLTRIVLTAILTPLGTLLCVVPLPKYSHVPIRFATAAAGSFGLVLCVSLLARIPAWDNVWARFWISSDIEWGTSKEKGLSAAYCLVLALGIFSDWLLHRQFGANPDEKWDHYLAEYSNSLPNDKNRAGTFEPLTSFWDRLVGRHSISLHPIVIIDDTVAEGLDAKPPPLSSLPPSMQPARRRSDYHPTTDLSDLKVTPDVLWMPHRGPFTFHERDKNDWRRVQFSPLHSHSVTLVDSDPKLCIGSQVEETWYTHSASEDSQSFTQPTAHMLGAHQHLDWRQFWQDVKAKIN